jgi:hypothetical protein
MYESGLVGKCSFVSANRAIVTPIVHVVEMIQSPMRQRHNFDVPLFTISGHDTHVARKIEYIRGQKIRGQAVDNNQY